MTLSGPCDNCGAPLQGDHAHCVICGKAPELSIPAEAAAIEAAGTSAAGPRFAIPLPPQMAVLATALALGFGGVIGSALSPDIETLLAATAAPVAAPAETVADAGGGGGGPAGGSGGSGGGTSSSPTTTPTSTPATSVAPTATTPVTDPVPEEVPPEELPPEDSDDDEAPLPPQGDTTATGTVVRVNPEAESYTLANGGSLSTVHAEDLPKPGVKIEVPVENVFNGTLSEASEREESGGEDAATFSGNVTFIDEEASLYVVSSAGASIPVRVKPPATGKPDLPPLSALITVEVEIGPAQAVEPGEIEPIDPGVSDPAADPSLEPVEPVECAAKEPFPKEPADPEIELTQTSFTVDFEELTTASLEGIVQATCPELDQIVISADDLRETGQDLTFTAPKEVDPSDLEAGDSVTVNGNPTPGEDGTLELTGIANDDGLKGADDQEAGQGDKAASVVRSRRFGFDDLRRLVR